MNIIVIFPFHSFHHLEKFERRSKKNHLEIWAPFLGNGYFLLVHILFKCEPLNFVIVCSTVYACEPTSMQMYVDTKNKLLEGEHIRWINRPFICLLCVMLLTKLVSQTVTHTLNLVPKNIIFQFSLQLYTSFNKFILLWMFVTNIVIKPHDRIYRILREIL
jgi:hypothetical protein